MSNPIQKHRFTTHARRLALISAAGLVVVLVFFSAATYLASRRAPSFYRQALSAPPADALEQGERFERAALALHNQVQRPGRWEAALTADEINGWLATELPAKFPQMLPTGIADPRVAIDGETFRAAVHYQRGGIDTVLSISGEAYLTAQDNEIAIRLTQARAGLVPIPLGHVIQEISQRAERAELSIRWTEVKGSPVALVRLPLDLADGTGRIVLDRLDTAHNQLLLAGRTESITPDTQGENRPATALQPDKDTRQR